MRVGILYSGGKDSNYAVYSAHKAGHELSCLITLVPYSVDSYLFHYPNADKAMLQARAMGLPILMFKSRSVGEGELGDVRRALTKAVKRFNIEGIYTGGIISRYQKERFQKVCEELRLHMFNPLWQRDAEEYLRHLIQLGFKVMIVGVSALGLDRSWLGRIIDERLLVELKELHKRFGVHIAFEGGEAETFVLDSPLFKSRVEVLKTEEKWMGDHGYLRIVKARLVRKVKGKAGRGDERSCLKG